ncbi:hypothetical protein, partial [Sansalvadorimonas verongulae]|uniref:hypothetical protein n=1 Tax=Sansalvadorimonas verongulae TaxID=2172824 RepID=UPI0018AD1C78
MFPSILSNSESIRQRLTFQILFFSLIAALCSFAYGSSEGKFKKKYTRLVDDEEEYNGQPEPPPVYSDAAGTEYLEVGQQKYRVQHVGDISVSTSSEYQGHQYSEITYEDFRSPTGYPPGSYFKTRVAFSVVKHDWSNGGRYSIDIWFFPNGLQDERYQGKILAVPHNLLKVDDQDSSTDATFHISTMRLEEAKVYSFASTLSLESPIKQKTVAKKFVLRSQPDQILEFGLSRDWGKFTDQLNQVTLRLTTSQETLLTQNNTTTSEHGHHYSFSIPRSRFDTGYDPKGKRKLGNASSIPTPKLQFNDIVIGLFIHVEEGKVAAKLDTISSYDNLRTFLEDTTSETVVPASGEQKKRIASAMTGICSKALRDYLADHSVTVYWIDPEHQQHKIAYFSNWTGKLEVDKRHPDTFYHSGK